MEGRKFPDCCPLPFHRSLPVLCLLLGALGFSKPAIGGPYTDSAHGDPSTGVDRTHLDPRYSRYVRGNCAHCHEQHGSLDGTEPTPSDASPSEFLLFTLLSDNALCYGCHDGSTPADNIQVQISGKSVAHNPLTDSASPPCQECHNPHLAQQPTAEGIRGNSAAAGAVKGAAGVTAVWSPPPPPGAGTETLSAPVYSPTESVTREYELCLKCHSSFPPAGPPAGLTDQGREFNPYNVSFHPVTGGGPWKNAYLRSNYATAFNFPWNQAAALDQRMYCSDCHGSDSRTEPRGPHGSNNVYMLKAVGPGISYDNLCLLCHRPLTSSAFGNHTTGQHQYSGGNLRGCLGCHGGNVGTYGGRRANIHGTNYQWPDFVSRQRTYPGLPATRFLVGGYITGLYQDGTSRGCAASDAGAGVNDGGCGGHAGGKTW